MRAECSNKLSSLQVECAAQLSLPAMCAVPAVQLPPAARAVGSCESSPGPSSLHGNAVQHQLHELERIESEAAGDANDHDESELNALVDEACASLKLQARLVTRFMALLRRLCLVRPCNWCWRTVLSPTALCRPLCGTVLVRSNPQWSFDGRQTCGSACKPQRHSPVQRPKPRQRGLGHSAAVCGREFGCDLQRTVVTELQQGATRFIQSCVGRKY